MLQNRLGKELLIFDGAMGTQLQNAGLSAGDIPEELNRSEERRVGKECRSRWSPYH